MPLKQDKEALVQLELMADANTDNLESGSPSRGKEPEMVLSGVACHMQAMGAEGRAR